MIKRTQEENSGYLYRKKNPADLASVHTRSKLNSVHINSVWEEEKKGNPRLLYPAEIDRESEDNTIIFFVATQILTFIYDFSRGN